MKKVTIYWEKKKKIEEEERLKWIGVELVRLECPDEDGDEIVEEMDYIKNVEIERSRILLGREEQWRNIWLSIGDENSNLFHKKAKGWKN